MGAKSRWLARQMQSHRERRLTKKKMGSPRPRPPKCYVSVFRAACSEERSPSALLSFRPRACQKLVEDGPRGGVDGADWPVSLSARIRHHNRYSEPSLITASIPVGTVHET